MHPNGGVIQTRLTGLDRDTYTIPLYTRPSPARKPLSEEEIMQAIDALGFVGRLRYFVEGVRFAEKHHGIVRDHNA
jgi:hypothetical protein